MSEEKPKTVIKFDSGADGFQYMMAVLAIGAVIVLISGFIFIRMTF